MTEQELSKLEQFTKDGRQLQQEIDTLTKFRDLVAKPPTSITVQLRGENNAVAGHCFDTSPTVRSAILGAVEHKLGDLRKKFAGLTPPGVIIEGGAKKAG